MLEIGVFLQGRYRIEGVLGQGGMGAVYLATEKNLGGKRVAVKEMTMGVKESSDRSSALAQFQKEASILATLDHPGLVDVTHYFEEDGKYYLVMAFIDGQTLDTLANEFDGFLPVSRVVDWVDQIADVLEYLHSQHPPIIFRDMKPSNVMLDPRNRIRLIDFGIARAFGTGKTDTFIKGAGTDGFAPIEQYGRNGTTDERTDVYAVGATAYSLLTHKLPPSAVDLMMHDDVLEPPSSVNAEVSPQLDEVVLSMMALRKNERYQTMTEVRNALQTVWVPPARTPRTLGLLPREGPETALSGSQGHLDPSTASVRAACLTCGLRIRGSETTCRRCSTPLPGASGAPAGPTQIKPVPPPAISGTRPRWKTPASVLLGLLLVALAVSSWSPVTRPGAFLGPGAVTMDVGEPRVTVEVNSVPAGADVFLDSRKVGRTPYKGHDFLPGLHWIRLRKDGYKEVHVKGRLNEGIPNRLNARLSPL